SVVDGENPMHEICSQSSTAEAQDTARIRARLGRFLERLRTLADRTTGESPVVTSPADKRLIKSLQVPQQFLFSEIKWPSPHFGIELCVTFAKPDRGIPR
ncbi:MAG TPA: hypothetical protein VHG32_18065, partial [Thermoanaerobaculia bacterium]|nr:hypothetical protein [Thermoanaerobaculia bacterium]